MNPCKISSLTRESSTHKSSHRVELIKIATKYLVQWHHSIACFKNLFTFADNFKALETKEKDKEKKAEDVAFEEQRQAIIMEAMKGKEGGGKQFATTGAKVRHFKTFENLPYFTVGVVLKLLNFLCHCETEVMFASLHHQQKNWMSHRGFLLMSSSIGST